MSFTYEALVCLGKQTSFNFPLDWSYSQAGKRELQGNFTAILNKFLKHFKKINVIYLTSKVAQLNKFYNVNPQSNL